MAGEKWLQISQIGKETTEGTAVAATRRLYVNGNFTRERAQNYIDFQTGTRDNKRDAKNRTVACSAKLSQPIIADDMIEWLLAAVKGNVSPTTANGESDWVFTPSATLDAQTLEFHDGQRGWQMRGCKIDELKLSGGAGKDTMADITYWGRELVVNGISGTSGVSEVQSLVDTGASAGTFTLTFLGQTTTAISYNAAAAAVQAALQALPSIGSGNVTCAGGALPAAVTITFAGNLAKLAGLPLITATSTLTGGTAVITRTTAGVDNTPLTDRVPNVIEGWEALLYVDAFGGTAGTTIMSSTLIDWEITLKNNLARKYFLDNTTAVGAVPLGALDIAFSATFEGNANALAEYYNWDQATKRLLRLDLGNNATAPVIGTSAKKPRVIIDLPCAYKAVDLSPEDNGTKVYKATGNYVYDPTNAMGIKFTLQTSRATAY